MDRSILGSKGQRLCIRIETQKVCRVREAEAGFLEEKRKLEEDRRNFEREKRIFHTPSA